MSAAGTKSEAVPANPSNERGTLKTPYGFTGLLRLVLTPSMQVFLVTWQMSEYRLVIHEMLA